MVCFLSKHQKSGIFYLWYTKEDGKRNKVSTKTKDKVEAEIFKASFIPNQKKELKIVDDEPISFIEYRNQFIDSIKDDYSSGTIELYQQTFKQFFIIIGNKPLRDISKDDIITFKKARLNTCKKVTINIDLRNLRSFLNVAVEEKLIEKNPLTNDLLFDVDETPIKFFSEEQINKVLNQIQCNHKRNIYKFAIQTGMRLSEILFLQYSDLNLEEMTIRITNKDNFRVKTGEIRYLPLTPNLLELIDLKYIDKPDTYIFGKLDNNKIQPYTSGYISCKFKKYCKRAKVPHYLHFHSLRHTFITEQIKRKTPIKMVQLMAGHKDIETTNKYIHLQTEDLREYMSSGVMNL